MNFNINETAIIGVSIYDEYNQPINLNGTTFKFKISNYNTNAVIYSGTTSTYVGDLNNQFIYCIPSSTTCTWSSGDIVYQASLFNNNNEIFYSEKNYGKIENVL